MNQQLSTKQRVRKTKTFKQIVKQGRFARGRVINLWVIKRSERFQQNNSELVESEDTGAAIGVVVGKKTHLRANKRNLCKRRIREVFRRNQAALKPNTSFVIQAKKNQKIPEYSEVKTDFVALCKKLGVMDKG